MIKQVDSYGSCFLYFLPVSVWQNDGVILGTHVGLHPFSRRRASREYVPPCLRHEELTGAGGGR